MTVLGVDVSSYNRSDSSYFKQLHHLGVKFVFVKLTEGTGWRNPSASAQIKHAFDNGINVVGGYHFFHGNGKAEARQFLANVKLQGLDKSTPLMLDAETSDIGGDSNINAFFDECWRYGYHNLFIYSMASYFDTYIHPAQLDHGHKWIADYSEYKPNIANMSIWQFTDNFHGLHTDGNICYNLPALGLKDQPKSDKVEKNGNYFYNSGSVFEVGASGGICAYSDASLHKKASGIPTRQAGYELHAKPVFDKKSGYWRLKTSYGNYYTANTKYLKKIK